MLFKDHLAASRIAVWPAVLLAAVGLGVFAFLELADEVSEGETARIDEAVLTMLRTPGQPDDPLGPDWLEEAAVEITALGGYPIITLLSLAVIGYLAISRRGWSALYVAVSVAGGAALSSVLKSFFERPRPDLVEQLDVIHTASFPSGHATAITVMYLTLASLFVRFLPTLREKIYVLAVAVFVAVLVGLTRVYLGVHWPSDVLAGWALGAAWASFTWSIAVILERKDAFVALAREMREARRVPDPSRD